MLLQPDNIDFRTFMGALSAAEEQLYTRPLITAHHDVAYHYTSIDRLQSILSGRQIWASDTSRLNDSAEVVKPLRNALSCLRQRKNELGQRGIVLEGLLDELERLTTAGVYTISLSRDRNSPEMWERYGDHSNGVNLGIVCSDLTLTKVRQSNGGWVTIPSDFLALKVDYLTSDSQFLQRAQAVVDVAARLNLSRGPVQLETCLNLLFRIWAASLKDAEPWSVEQEVRFVSKTVLLPNGSGRYFAGSGPAQEPASHAAPDGTSIRHLVASLPPSAVKTVTLGPATTQESADRVSQILTDSGIGADLLAR